MSLEVEEHGIYPIGALEIYVVEFSLTAKYWINYCSCTKRDKLLRWTILFRIIPAFVEDSGHA